MIIKEWCCCLFWVKACDLEVIRTCLSKIMIYLNWLNDAVLNECQYCCFLTSCAMFLKTIKVQNLTQDCKKMEFWSATFKITAFFCVHCLKNCNLRSFNKSNLTNFSIMGILNLSQTHLDLIHLLLELCFDTSIQFSLWYKTSKAAILNVQVSLYQYYNCKSVYFSRLS